MAQHEKVTIEVEERNEFGKNANRRLRAAGRVPGNVYGLTAEPFPIVVDPRRVDEVLRTETGRNTIVNLALAGKEQRREVMFREIQRDPVTERYVHVEFMRIDPDKKLTFDVPVRLLGTAYGVKNEGGILDFIHRTVQLSCLPHNVPDHIDIDVTDVHLGQNVGVKDLALSDDVEVLDDPDTILIAVSAPKVEATEPEEGEEVEAEEGAEAATDATAEGGEDEKKEKKED